MYLIFRLTNQRNFFNQFQFGYLLWIEGRCTNEYTPDLKVESSTDPIFRIASICVFAFPRQQIDCTSENKQQGKDYRFSMWLVKKSVHSLKVHQRPYSTVVKIKNWAVLLF